MKPEARSHHFEAKERQRKLVALILTLQAIPPRTEDAGARVKPVFEALHQALELGFPAGCRVSPRCPETVTAWIALPTGVAAWTLPQEGAGEEIPSPTECAERVAFFRQMVLSGIGIGCEDPERRPV